MNKKEFMQAANGKSGTRTFGESDYKAFTNAVRAAKRAAKQGKPLYRWDHAGGVANAYKYVTQTAVWGVWSTPAGEVVAKVRRVDISGSSVPHAYKGGERSYGKYFREALAAEAASE